MTKSRYVLLALLVVAAVSFRIMPYVLGALGLTDVRQFAGFLWNFSPVSALFLFCGAHFPEKRWAYGAPLAAMLLSDLGIGLLMNDMSLGIHAAIPAIYGSYALIVLAGTLVRKLERHLAKNGGAMPTQSWPQRIRTFLTLLAAVAGAGIAGEVAFFIITNFATWLMQTGYYPHTWDGLMSCYIAGIPFFKNSLQSMPLFAFVLFGGSALAEAWFPALREQAAPDSTGQVALA
ncbi:MAG: hypothetical protein HY290_11705 [Planctomycetia bacterium]|nr:hypothetical protein [Planctomycetia bacterium]